MSSSPPVKIPAAQQSPSLAGVHSVKLTNFKRFEKFYLSARKANVLVGPNNSGKSSILDVLRIAQACLRYARRNSPRPMDSRDHGIVLGYILPHSSLPVPIANITTNYSDDDAVIEIRCNNGNRLIVSLNPDRQILFYALAERDSTKTSNNFRRAIPLDIIIVPPLGPFEEFEGSVTDETISRNEASRLSNRHFRNIWLRKNRQEFGDLVDLLSSTWPGMNIKPPEIMRGERSTIQMFYSENRIDRELYWSGFGFQVWLQMLTHIMRCSAQSILVIDEPDIYLHPDLQRKLLRLVRSKAGQFFMATHSIEIINDAEPGDIISIDPAIRTGKRVSTDEEYQALFNYIGSVENVDFSRLGRARRLIFFEGHDKKMLRKYAGKTGATNFANDLDTTILQSGGFGQWRRVKEVAWTFREVLKLEVEIFALFDRDYRSAEEVDAFLLTMREQGIKCFVLGRKEIENYALTRENIYRTIESRQKERLGEEKWLKPRQINRLIDAASNQFRHDTHAQILGQRTKYLNEMRSKIDPSTIAKEISVQFEKDWKDVDKRLRMLAGKDFIAQLSARLQRIKGFSITTMMLIDSLKQEEIDPDLVQILSDLDQFCKRQTKP